MPKDKRSRNRAAWVSSKSISLDITPSVIPRRESLTNSSVNDSGPRGTPNIWILTVGVIGTLEIGLSSLQSGSSQDHSHFWGFKTRPSGSPPALRISHTFSSNSGLPTIPPSSMYHSETQAEAPQFDQ